jgi:Mg-chelatase subunit ChlD
LKKENPNNEYIVSVSYFEDEVMDIVKFASIEEIQLLSRENYRPGGLTALLDGIGKSIEAIRRKYDQEIREDLASVVMVILTDGGENASKFYTRNLIAETIKELDATGKWTFSFLGADLDAVSASDNLNIRRENIISFSKGNYDKVMQQMSSSIRNYENMKSSGNMKSDLFDDIDEKDQRTK